MFIRLLFCTGGLDAGSNYPDLDALCVENKGHVRSKTLEANPLQNCKMSVGKNFWSAAVLKPARGTLSQKVETWRKLKENIG